MLFLVCTLLAAAILAGQTVAEILDWKAAYSSMKVDFGMTDNSPSGQYSISGIRSSEGLGLRLGRRQVAASTSVVYPVPPTSTPSALSSVHDIGFSKVNSLVVTWSKT